MKRFLGCLLAALLALSLCACAESAQAGKATVTVDQSALYARVGEEVTLPAATAADAEGKDCSSSVSVTVTFGGSTVFSGKGNAENTFTPTQEGAYTANYFVAEGESVLSDTYTVNIQVNDNTPVEPARSAPVIRVDTSYASFYEDEGGSTRAAVGYDEVDKDLIDSVRVSVTDYEGEAVFSGVGGAEHALTGLAVGTYTVTYSLENSAGLSAEEKSYRLTVVSSANIAPELHAPTKDYSLFVGETLAIAPATAEDYEDGERAVSYELRAAGGAVLSSGTADSVHRYTFTEAGSYTVEYTAEDTEGVQVSADYAVTVTAVTESGIVMDGIVNEKEYFAIPSYTLGVSGNTTYRFIAADEGLYIGAVVSDRNLPDCYFVDSSDLEMGLLDWWHFRASSMLELGRRFAGALTAAAGEKVPVSVEPVRLETGVGEAPSLPQYVSARTESGGLCLFPARFEIEPSDYAAVGSHTVGGYVLYGENYGLSFEAELTVKDGAKVDGSLGDAVWQDAAVHEIALTADGTGLPPYYPAEATFMVYAGEDGLYFAFDVKDAKLATNYNLTTAADWNLWQNDGIEVYIDASGGAAASLTEDSLTVRCTASDLLRVYAPNAAYSGWSVTNLYNSQAERVQGIRRELCIDGTPNQAYDADEGYTFELFVPYSVFGTDEISDYRIAAGVRSRANIPGGTETAFGAWSAAEQATFTGVSPAQWVALADAL